MKLSLAPSLTLTLLAGLAAARDCSAGYNYCGSTLNRIGDNKYQWSMEQACNFADKECLGDEVNDHLFSCRLKGRQHEFRVLKECKNGCWDRGFGRDDKCRD